MADSADFIELRRVFRRFVFPLTAVFLLWYFLYVLLSNYAHGFMSKKVLGNIHLGLVFGLLQFVSTFVITMVYARWADRTFDARAAELGARVPELAGVAPGTDPPGATQGVGETGIGETGMGATGMGATGMGGTGAVRADEGPVTR